MLKKYVYFVDLVYKSMFGLFNEIHTGLVYTDQLIHAQMKPKRNQYFNTTPGGNSLTTLKKFNLQSIKIYLINHLEMASFFLFLKGHEIQLKHMFFTLHVHVSTNSQSKSLRLILQRSYVYGLLTKGLTAITTYV